MLTAGIWSKSKLDVEFQYGGRLACHPRATWHIAGCCNRAKSIACYPRATYYIAGCCHLVNSLSCSQVHRATCHIAGCSHLAKSMTWSCHIAGCKNSIRHIENRFSPYFIFFWFLMQFRLWRAAAFVSSSIHLFETCSAPSTNMCLHLCSSTNECNSQKTDKRNKLGAFMDPTIKPPPLA